MRGGVGGVVKLAQDKGAGDAVLQGLRLLNGAFHAFCAGGEHQLRAIGPQQIATLLAHGLRHGENHFIPLGNAHPGQAHAGVAAGGLDEGGAGGQEAFFLCIGNHGQGHAVFHAAAGIKGFQLYKDIGLLSFHRMQFKQRRMADQVCKIRIYHIDSELETIVQAHGEKKGHT